MSIKTEEEIRNFIDNVILIRKKSGLSKEDMARILNIKLDSVDKIEAGELSDDVSVEVIFKIYSSNTTIFATLHVPYAKMVNFKNHF